MPLVVTYVESWSIELVLVRFIWAFVVRFYPQNIEYINSLQIAWFQLFDFVNYILCFFLCNFTSHGIWRYIIFNIFFFVPCVGQPKPVLTRWWTFSINPSKHSSWLRRLEGVLKRSFVFVFKRRLQDVWIRLDQSKYIRFSHKSSEDVIKTSWSRPISSGHTSSRRLQEVFAKHFENALKSSRRSTKACSRHLQDVLPKCLQDVFKISSRHLAKTT